MAERKSSGEPKKPASKDEAKPDEKTEPKAEAKTEPKAEQKVEAKTESKAEQKPAAKPIANIEDRMEGVQGWMAELEKRQERTSRVGGIALLLAILAAGGALALGILNKQDAATTEDVDELTSKVNALGASVEKQTETQLKGHQRAPGLAGAPGREPERAPAQDRGRHRDAEARRERRGGGRRGGRSQARAEQRRRSRQPAALGGGRLWRYAHGFRACAGVRAWASDDCRSVISLGITHG